MIKIETGGPAFASGVRRKVRQSPGDAGSDWVLSAHEDPVHEGMTLRDYFAAKAMQALITGYLTSDVLIDPPQDSEKSYSIADAMLVARNAEK